MIITNKEQHEISLDMVSEISTEYKCIQRRKDKKQVNKVYVHSFYIPEIV